MSHSRYDELTRKEIYEELLKVIPSVPDQAEFNTHGRLNVCIIEYRAQREITYVLRALLQVYKPQEIGITFICGNKNEDYVKSLFPHWKNLRIINTGHDNLNRKTYSSLLKMPTFWENFTEWSHVLIYQTDALIMRKIEDIYFTFDYIGAPWGLNNQWVPVCAGNGGFSLRNVRACIQHCEEFRNVPQEKIPTTNEDGFFCRSKIFKYPPINSETHKRFSVEQVFHPRPIGCHQLYRYLNNTQFHQLINYVSISLNIPQEIFMSKFDSRLNSLIAPNTSSLVKSDHPVLIFRLFGGVNGVGFYNQIFSLELAIFMANYFKRKLYLIISHPLAAKGKCLWSLGTIFHYIRPIEHLLPYGFELFDKNRRFEDIDHTYTIRLKKRMSSCYYVDESLRKEENKHMIQDFANRRIDISKDLDILFRSEVQYVAFNDSNASRVFTNFLVKDSDYLLMNKITHHFCRLNDYITRVVTSVKLPEKFISFHFRFGDVHKSDAFLNKDNKCILENIVPWLEKVNTQNLPIIVMADNENHTIIERLKQSYEVLLTS